MLCAISGEAPQVPVISSKSGNVFERRLVEAYIAENGKDPINGAEMTAEDLIEVKSSRIIRPRPPTLTSIPSLLSVFQNEWDALALETYTLRQQLAQTRQELSTALYQHDAAVRVVGRLLQERDEAREALSKINASGGQTNGDEMQVDSAGIPEAIVEQISATYNQLSGGRRKRPVPVGWTTSETIQSFKPTATSSQVDPPVTSLSLNESGELAFVGAKSGRSVVYNVADESVKQSLDAQDGAITDSLWWGNSPVTASSTGVVRIWGESLAQCSSYTPHAGAIAAIDLHPRGNLMASVGSDKSYALHDLEATKVITQVYNDSALTCTHFHPDGHLLGAGSASSQIKIFDVRANSIAATFEPLNGPANSIHFSENGFWLAASSKGDNSVSIWDLRKAAVAKSLDIGSQVEAVKWDYTGQYLATAGAQGITVQHYAKSSKAWSETLRSAVPAFALSWGAQAGSLVSLNAGGELTVHGA